MGPSACIKEAEEAQELLDKLKELESSKDYLTDIDLETRRLDLQAKVKRAQVINRKIKSLEEGQEAEAAVSKTLQSLRQLLAGTDEAMDGSRAQKNN